MANWIVYPSSMKREMHCLEAVPEAIENTLISIWESYASKRISGDILKEKAPTLGLSTASIQIRTRKCLSLTLKTDNLANATVLRCQGKLVFRNEAKEFARKVAEVFEQNIQALVLDLSGIELIDGAGLGALAQAANWARDRKTALRCCQVNNHVLQLLNLTRLSSVIEIHSSEAAALKAVSAAA